MVVNNNPDITNLQLGARRMTYPLEEYEANGETIRAAVDQWLGGQDKMSTSSVVGLQSPDSLTYKTVKL